MRCVPQRRGYLFLLHGVFAERKHYKKHTEASSTANSEASSTANSEASSTANSVQSPTSTINQLKHGRAGAVLRYNGRRIQEFQMKGSREKRAEKFWSPRPFYLS